MSTQSPMLHELLIESRNALLAAKAFQLTSEKAHEVANRINRYLLEATTGGGGSNGIPAGMCLAFMDCVSLLGEVSFFFSRTGADGNTVQSIIVVANNDVVAGQLAAFARDHLGKTEAL